LPAFVDVSFLDGIFSDWGDMGSWLKLNGFKRDFGEFLHPFHYATLQ
jgi:hypothetical protein